MVRLDMLPGMNLIGIIVPANTCLLRLYEACATAKALANAVGGARSARDKYTPASTNRAGY